MENLTVNILTLSTTKKKGSKGKNFTQEYPTKTAIFTVDKKEAKKLVDFGLTQYTPEDEEGTPFFMAKLTRNVSVYNVIDKEQDEPIKIDGGLDEPNFKVENTKINLFKGEKDGNSFTRVQAILVKSSNDIEELKAVNPFL